MGPVQGHQCPYDAPSVAEHFRKTGTVNLNPADVLLFRDSLCLTSHRWLSPGIARLSEFIRQHHISDLRKWIVPAHLHPLHHGRIVCEPGPCHVARELNTE